MKASISNNKKSAAYVAAGCILFTFVLTGFGFLQAGLVNGELCYALDDSFIMMAISKHLAFQHVWGLTPYEFSSTASSPLFTVLLTGCILLFGDQLWLPLAINLLAFSGLMFWLARLGLQWKMKIWQIWFLLFGLVTLAPIPVLLFGSMEHIVHIWIALYCLFYFVENQQNTSILGSLLLGVLLAGIRYEGLFEGGLLVLWLWKEKQWAKGFALGLGMMIPVFALGLYSMSQGWFFLPNSLVLKGYTMNFQETGGFLGYLLSWVAKAANHPHAMAAMLALWLIQQEKDSQTSTSKHWVGFAFWMSVVHFVLARYNHVYRYEAYLMAIAWVTVWKWTCQHPHFQNIHGIKIYLIKNKAVLAFMVALLISPLYRSIDSYVVGTRAIVNIYQQQVQTARFVKENYNTQTIGALDVGAIAYYTDARLLDLWGLGSLDFARLKLAENYTNPAIDSVARRKGMEVAIAYGNNMDCPNWIRTASWVIPNNAVCSRDTVDFYGLRPEVSADLLRRLKKFEPQLPPDVSVCYWK